MVRHLLRATVALIALGGSLFCLAVCRQCAGLWAWAGAGGNGFMSDPFNFYYAFYLPNQQLQSLRPRPIDTLNQAVASRQYYAA